MTEPSLEDLDAVGPARADLLRKYGFETVESLVEATPAKLVEIDGIDEATATDILASVVRVLDRSKPTVDTPRSKLASPTFSPFRPLPFTPPTIDRSERRWNADGPRPPAVRVTPSGERNPAAARSAISDTEMCL
jgi:hypothetical protein